MGKEMTLILGGARSGKSSYAQSMFEAIQKPVLFVATATAGDEEMAARIVAHRANRPLHWITLEVPIGVGAAIDQSPDVSYVLIDCMTLLISNVLLSCSELIEDKLFFEKITQELNGLLDTYDRHEGEWVIVSNEVGLGLVPAYPLGRYYRDALGKVNQKLAQKADKVILMVSGIPVVIKDSNVSL